ncbi:MAG: hypothetical protein ACOCRK_05740 [bacterium]
MSQVVKRLNFNKYIISDKKTRELIAQVMDWDYFCNLGYEVEMIQLYLGYVQDGTYSGDYISDGIYEIGDDFVPIYIPELFGVYADNLGMLGWFEEAKAQGLMDGTNDLIKMLYMGVYEYNTYILYKVANHFDLI